MPKKLTLLEKLEQTKQQRAIELEKAIETRKLENELSYINSDRYLEDEIKEKDNAALKEITDALDNISNKHFTRYGEFNFGYQANALIGAVKTCMLQKKLGLVALEEARLLNPKLEEFCELVEHHAQAFPDAIGRNTYFDKLSGQIVQGTIGNAEETKAILETLARHMGLISPDFSQITQAKFNFIEERSAHKAQQEAEDNKLLQPSNEEVSEDTTAFKSA